MNELKISCLVVKFLGKKEAVYRLHKGSELLGVYASKEEAESAKAAIL